MGFRKPSKIQERALPLLLANPPTNMIGQSQSGTGKTAAFVLNILSRIELATDEQRKTPQALVLAPSRELARQISSVVEHMGRFLEGLVVGLAVPTEAKRPARLEASVVVGTPGTVMDLTKRRILLPQRIKVLVLDEADNMLDQQGLGDQCIRVKAFVLTSCLAISFSQLLTPASECYPRRCRWCFSPPLSDSISAVMPPSSLRMRTRSPSSKTSSPLRASSSSILTARMTMTNTTCWSSFTVSSPLDPRSSLSRCVLSSFHLHE